jgi:hypothetical protein
MTLRDITRLPMDSDRLMGGSRLVLAVAFFVVWLVILLAGADWPPPPGFWRVVLLDAVAAGIVYWRTATYGAWCATGQRSRALRAGLEGFGAGIAVAGLVMLFNPGGEPGISPSWRDRSIWFGVVGAVGAVNALLVFGGSCVIRRLVLRGSAK